ncbi:hypothetical protein WN48_10407 [Eufriesea mexicana]|nr:hypothetical protein WN48_10407 [Eufriesea mexicana]
MRPYMHTYVHACNVHVYHGAKRQTKLDNERWLDGNDEELAKPESSIEIFGNWLYRMMRGQTWIRCNRDSGRRFKGREGGTKTNGVEEGTVKGVDRWSGHR